MSRRCLPVLVTGLLLVVLLGATDELKVAEDWKSPGVSTRQFGNILVVAITDQQEARHRFEDKFVSHLRSQGVQGMTSHSLVADLQVIEDRDKVIDTLLQDEVDGVISIRLIPLDGRDEEEWSAAWRTQAGSEETLRELIRSTLPVKETNARRYGVEVALWSIEARSRVWAGRTEGYKLKHLKKRAGNFVENVMYTLKDANRF